MACFISAGHHLKDPGAVANGLKEADLTRRVRDRVVEMLRKAGYKVFVDDDRETLAEYLKRIEPGTGSVVCEFHFDAASNPAATGTSTFYADGASEKSKDFAFEMATTGAEVMGIKLRGAFSESQSHRGRLGLVQEPGINCLVEVGFITNLGDLDKFKNKFEVLCHAYANVIAKYDDKIK